MLQLNRAICFFYWFLSKTPRVGVFMYIFCVPPTYASACGSNCQEMWYRRSSEVWWWGVQEYATRSRHHLDLTDQNLSQCTLFNACSCGVFRFPCGRHCESRPRGVGTTDAEGNSKIWEVSFCRFNSLRSRHRCFLFGRNDFELFIIHL